MENGHQPDDDVPIIADPYPSQEPPTEQEADQAPRTVSQLPAPDPGQQSHDTRSARPEENRLFDISPLMGRNNEAFQTDEHEEDNAGGDRSNQSSRSSTSYSSSYSGSSSSSSSSFSSSSSSESSAESSDESQSSQVLPDEERKKLGDVFDQFDELFNVTLPDSPYDGRRSSIEKKRRKVTPVIKIISEDNNSNESRPIVSGDAINHHRDRDNHQRHHHHHHHHHNHHRHHHHHRRRHSHHHGRNEDGEGGEGLQIDRILAGLSRLPEGLRSEALQTDKGFSLEDVKEEDTSKGFANFVLTDSLSDALRGDGAKHKDEKHHHKHKHHKHKHHHHRHHKHNKTLHRQGSETEILEAKLATGIQILQEEQDAIHAMNEQGADATEYLDISPTYMTSIGRSVLERQPSKLDISLESMENGIVVQDMPEEEHFVELLQLNECSSGQRYWDERVRWMKFEEVVEKNNRWGKPRVSSLSFHSLLELRKGMEYGTCRLDLPQAELSSIYQVLVDDLVRKQELKPVFRDYVCDVLMSKQVHHHQRSKKGKILSVAHTLQNFEDYFLGLEEDPKKKKELKKMNLSFPQHQKDEDDIPKVSDLQHLMTPNTKGTVVMVAEIEELDRPAMGFIRLEKGITFDSLLEVSIPTHFIFLVCGPPSSNHNYFEIGRSLGILMSDEEFYKSACMAKERSSMLTAINVFLDESIVMSPGDWNRHLLLPLLKYEITAKKKERKKLEKAKSQSDVPVDQQPFLRTGIPFGGLARDIKLKSKFFLSDIYDGFDLRCLICMLFIFFATLAPTLAFGALLMRYTDGHIGVMETLLATSVCGSLFSLTAGQPLIIIGTTGPIIVFEQVVYELCKLFDGPFFEWRLWIGLWTMVILWAVVAAEACFLIENFTRFIEEVFSVLISFLFLYEAIAWLDKTFDAYYHVLPSNTTNHSCIHMANNGTSLLHHVPPTNGEKALISLLLLLGTYYISHYLKKLRFSHFFTSKYRRMLSDFGVPISMVVMVAISYATDDPSEVPRIEMPDTFRPTDKSRESFIVPDFWKIPVSWVFSAIIPAMGVSVLLFLETGMTGLLVNKEQNLLKKGGGYNLDLFMIGLCCGLSSVFGLTWMCPGPIRSVQHLKALAVMSRKNAPGEEPYLVEIKEQRMTNLLVYILTGLILFAIPVIKLIPLAVCYGVFLYFGFSSLPGVQLVEQIKLIFVPQKFHPNKGFVRNVRFKSLISYTAIQLVCLIILIVLKLTVAAPGFPFFLILMVFIRKLMNFVYPEEELNELDNEEEEDEEFDEDNDHIGF